MKTDRTRSGGLRKITISDIRKLAPGETLFDPCGLVVRRRQEATSFVYRYRRHNKTRTYTVGRYGKMTLDTARRLILEPGGLAERVGRGEDIQATKATKRAEDTVAHFLIGDPDSDTPGGYIGALLAGDAATGSSRTLCGPISRESASTLLTANRRRRSPR